MIYLSSACVPDKTLSDVVLAAIQHGFHSLELSAGCRPEPLLKGSLLSYQAEYGLQYLIHNYFPPPAEPFVLNLASLDQAIFSRSLDHCLRAIEWCRSLGCPKYAVHGGFFLDLAVEELGRPIRGRELRPRDEAVARFSSAWDELRRAAGRDVALYIENNVLTRPNLDRFQGKRPFMLLDLADYRELREEFPFDLLLDVGHLKVSCHTLGRDFESELRGLFALTDYVHISDNDGLTDDNGGLTPGSHLECLLSRLDWGEKDVTIEVYQGWPAIETTAHLLKGYLRDGS